MGRKYSKKEYREFKKAGKVKKKVAKDRKTLIQEYENICRQIEEIKYRDKVYWWTTPEIEALTELIKKKKWYERKIFNDTLWF